MHLVIFDVDGTLVDSYVGDGEWDHRAAMAHGTRFVGVGDNPRMLRLAGGRAVPDFRHAGTFFDMI